MINRPTVVLSIALAASCAASVAFGQTREAFGPVLPMVFDGQGGRHYCLNGYYGPFDPSIGATGDYTTVVCPRAFVGPSWLPTVQKEQLSARKAKAQVNARK